MRHRFALLIAAAVLCAPSVSAQMIVLNAKSVDDLRSQLRNGPPPDVVINEPLVLGQNETWVVKRLRFERGGRIYLQQFDLDLTVREELQLTTWTQPLFVSFLPKSKAIDGKPGRDRTGETGGAGADGLSSGNLTLRLPAKTPNRAFPVDLEGQSGGNGGKGGSGAPGTPGALGTRAMSGVFNCIRPATPGSPGGRGGNGGDGGPGGACGRGGTIRIDHEHFSQAIPVTASLAAPGRGGSGGDPGPGGPGGEGGLGGGFCSSAPNGNAGSPGDRGKTGSIGGSCIAGEKVDLGTTAVRRKKK